MKFCLNDFKGVLILKNKFILNGSLSHVDSGVQKIFKSHLPFLKYRCFKLRNDNCSDNLRLEAKIATSGRSSLTSQVTCSQHVLYFFIETFKKMLRTNVYFVRAKGANFAFLTYDRLFQWFGTLNRSSKPTGNFSRLCWCHRPALLLTIL